MADLPLAGVGAELDRLGGSLGLARASLDLARPGLAGADRLDREQERRHREQERQEREQELYERGSEALDEGRWQRALDAFDRVTKMGGRKADGALYWTAYAQNRLGQRAEALATLAELSKTFPKSRWVNDARALEMEVRQSSGQRVRPDREPDEDLKLMALNGLMNSDPEQAIPMLEKFLSGSDSPRLKARALFVLAESGSPRAREVLAQIARGGSNPDLQMRAIKYLGLFGGKESRQTLADIYASAADVDVKRQVLQSFMVAGERDRVLAAAKGEQNAALRAEAVRLLGVMSAQAELWQVYQGETSPDVKKQIIQALFIGGDATRLAELARTEKDAELRRTAVHTLGLMGSKKTGDTLVAIYRSDKDPEIRKTVINALFIQGNAHALVEIARQETDPTLRKDAVQKLSLMKSKEATDFLMEILKK